MEPSRFLFIGKRWGCLEALLSSSSCEFQMDIRALQLVFSCDSVNWPHEFLFLSGTKGVLRCLPGIFLWYLRPIPPVLWR
jgi:hypothetical protein